MAGKRKILVKAGARPQKQKPGLAQPTLWRYLKTSNEKDLKGNSVLTDGNCSSNKRSTFLQNLPLNCEDVPRKRKRLSLKRRSKSAAGSEVLTTDAELSQSSVGPPHKTDILPPGDQSSVGSPQITTFLPPLSPDIGALDRSTQVLENLEKPTILDKSTTMILDKGRITSSFNKQDKPSSPSSMRFDKPQITPLFNNLDKRLEKTPLFKNLDRPSTPSSIKLEEKTLIKSQDKHVTSSSFNTSIPLFSTPSEAEISTPRQVTTASAKRALFHGTPNCQGGCSSNVSFQDDISLSEFLDCSLADSSVNEINQYLVLEVGRQMSAEITENGRQKPELKLRLLQENLKIEKIYYLRDDWFNLAVKPGDMVQVNLGCRISDVLDNAAPDSSVIVHPNTLVSATSVANSIICTRKAVLAERFKGVGERNEAMILGQMLHKVFQTAMVKCQEESLKGEALETFIRHTVESTVSTLDSLDNLYALEMSETEAKEKLCDHVPAIRQWCDRFMHSEPQQGEGSINFKRPGDTVCESCVCVSDVVDIEENIWSPRFGLKGKIDATVNVKEKRGDQVETMRRVPLELKTGKVYNEAGTVEHRAQVILYGLMLSDRNMQCPPPSAGLLFYLRAGMQGLPFLDHEKRGLIMARNNLACFYSTQPGPPAMPGMLKSVHTCKKCPHLKQCTLYHKSIENGSASTSGLGEIFDQTLSHVSSSHSEFFSKWFELLYEEERSTRAKRSIAPWLFSAQEREQEGAGLSDMVAHPPTVSADRYLQRFTKQACFTSSDSSLLSLSRNDRVVISLQDGSAWALAMGAITRVLPGPDVEVSLDKAVSCQGGVVYRIDEVSGYSSGIALSNMADLCVSDGERQHSLRELIIDSLPPKFTTTSMASWSSQIEHLNSDQKAAIRKVMTAKDYTLILGMPGTGKTTTIACLVKVLVSQGKSVLLTSYTHSAVDNILLKLKRNGVPFLRLGPTSRINPTLQDATPTHLCAGMKTVAELNEFYCAQSVVATTCLGIGHPVLSRRLFDVCVVDEASQITLPICLGPLKCAHTFVLVGDHYQLPPLVLSNQARDGGLDMSLFHCLGERHPTAVVSLNKQYRMNWEIMRLANNLVYEGGLQCGSDEVAESRLYLPHFPCSPASSTGDWLEAVIDPQRPVLFLDTDGCSSASEQVTGGQISNRWEADLTLKIVEKLIKYGLPGEDIGIITPLRHQQFLISEQLRKITVSLCPEHTTGHTTGRECHSHHDTCMDTTDQTPHSRGTTAGSHHDRHQGCCNVECSTVDTYQGRDKECIIMSFVRSNMKGNTGVLLKDWRRINVAITRAKHKLLLIGSQSTLRNAPFLNHLLNQLEIFQVQ